MKKILKKKLDKAIELTREYWATGNTDILGKRISLAQSLEKQTHVWWDAILYLLDGILETHGFYPDAENDEIYCALRCLGWEVTDGEDKTSEGL